MGLPFLLFTLINYVNFCFIFASMLIEKQNSSANISMYFNYAHEHIDHLTFKEK